MDEQMSVFCYSCNKEHPPDADCDGPQFKGSPEELAVALESMMLRLTDLINQADQYDLEELKDIDVGVWFLVGSALSVLGQAKRLLLGEDPAEIAEEWLRMSERKEETDDGESVQD